MCPLRSTCFPCDGDVGWILHPLLYCVLFLAYKKDLSRMPWMHWVAMLTIPLDYLAGQAGWVVAECGRQPWAIQDMLPKVPPSLSWM